MMKSNIHRAHVACKQDKQAEDKITEELGLRKLIKSSVKVFKHGYEQTLNTIMRK